MQAISHSVKHRKHSLLLPVLTRLLALALALTGAVVSAQDAAEAVKPVKVMAVSADSAGVTRTFFGRVSARQTVDLAFQVSGQMVEFPAIEGEIIAAGGLVAKLDQEPFQLALDRRELHGFLELR